MLAVELSRQNSEHRERKENEQGCDQHLCTTSEHTAHIGVHNRRRKLPNTCRDHEALKRHRRQTRKVAHEIERDEREETRDEHALVSMPLEKPLDGCKSRFRVQLLDRFAPKRPSNPKAGRHDDDRDGDSRYPSVALGSHVFLPGGETRLRLRRSKPSCRPRG